MERINETDGAETESSVWRAVSEMTICGDVETGSISSEEDESGQPDLPSLDKPTRDLWQTEELVESLRRLSGADEIAPLVAAGRAEEVARHSCAAITGVLWACWRARPHLLARLLAGETRVAACDGGGRTALHLSCIVGSEECTKLLLQHGADPHVWDSQRKATPLHCAASAKSLGCIQLLIAYGADVNAGVAAHSPLHYAVLSDAPQCVRALLDAGACPDTPQVFTETPLHAAASAGAAECVRLLVDHGADVRARLGSARSTALHLAALDGHAECARLLLQHPTAEPDARNKKMQTPLHLACLAQSVETVEELVAGGAAVCARDADGRTPLHCAVAKAARGCDVARTLLRAGADPNRPDAFGYTPVHIAALNEFSECICLLLEFGGDVTLRTNGGVSVLGFIVRRTPDVIPRYLATFDAAIRPNEHELGDVDCELKMDFRVLVPCLARGETELMLAFIEVGLRDVLKHPLCETFLFLKWKIIRKFFIFSLVYHAVFVTLFSLYIIEVYLRDCPSHNTTQCSVFIHVKIIGYLLVIFNLCLLAKEIFQACHSWTAYIKQWENWLQWFITVGIFLCVIPGREGKVSRCEATWQHDAAALTVFAAWVELMMIVGRFPMFGLYVQMFTTVAVNFSKFLLAYSCLLIAFGLAFGVLFANYPSFKNVVMGLVKTVMMMSGELEYEDIFYNPEEFPIQYPVTAHVLFLAFVLLVTVVLTNLLVGLAVSDIQALQESAGLDRLVRQAEQVAHLESMLFSPLLRRAPSKALSVCRRGALLTASAYRCRLTIRPNDPRECRIPKDLIMSIFKLAASRKPDKRSRRRSNYKCEISKRNEGIFAKVENKDRNLSKMGNLSSDYDYVQRRIRNTSYSGENRIRPASCNSPMQDFSVNEIRNQMIEMNRKLDRWMTITETRLLAVEQKSLQREPRTS